MNSTIHAENISFQYRPDTPIFRHITTTVPKSSFTALVGPNGAGKSTLLRLFAGILQPQSGTVFLCGVPIKNYPGRERAKIIGFLPQFISPLFPLTVKEAVTLGRYPHRRFLHKFTKQDEYIIEQSMEIMNVLIFKDRYLNELSGGEIKRVCIASILAQEPQLLILDEPLAGLDIPNQIDTLTYLKKLSEIGYTICMATHELNLIIRFASRILLMSSHHEIIAEGDPDSVLTSKNLCSAYNANFWIGTHPRTGSILLDIVEKTNHD